VPVVSEEHRQDGAPHVLVPPKIPENDLAAATAV
jgi:hypothetical protein